MRRPRIMLVFGTRPEAIKLFPIVRALRAHDQFETMVCVTGQHRALLDQVLGLAGIRPDIDLDLMTPGQSLDALTARLLVALGELFDADRPDRIVVQGDTASAMAASLAAYYRRIPVAHVEAGLRSGDLLSPWPEEGNRRIITSLADLHFAPTAAAADALQQAGADPAQLHVTGNSGIDALLQVREMLRAGHAASAEIAALAAHFAGRRLVAVTCHRRENQGAALDDIARALVMLAQREDVALLMPLHPNPQVGAVFRAALSDLPNVALLPPLDYPDFVALLDACHSVLTDSGGVQEEAPALGRPVLVMRETTERPEGVMAGTARLVGTDPRNIVAEANRLLDDAQAYVAMARVHFPYGDGRAAERIAAILSRDMAGASKIPLTSALGLA